VNIVFNKMIIVIPYIFLILLNIAFKEFSAILSIYTVIVLFLTLLKTRDSQPLFIVVLFIASYSIMPMLYFVFDIKISFYTLFANYEAYSNTLNYQAIFVASLYIFSKTTYKKNRKIIDGLPLKNNILIYNLNIAIMIFIILFGKSGNNLFLSGGYGSVNSSLLGETALWEYILIFTLGAYVFSGKIKIRLFIILVISGLFIIKDILLGGRIASLQLLILNFILIFENKFSNKQFKIIILIGFIVFFFFGAIRDNPDKYFSDFSQLLFDPYTILSNQGEVFYSSTLLIALVNEDVIDVFYRLKSLIGNIISLFMPSRFVFEEADIIWIASRRLGGTGGGGLLTSYFYLWLGPIGVFLIGNYISTIFNKLYYNTNKYFKYYSILVLSTAPRWYAYKPLALFKLSLYVVIVLFIFFLVDNQMLKSNRYNNRLKGVKNE